MLHLVHAGPWSWMDLAEDLTTVVATEYPATVENDSGLWVIWQYHGA